ncbi:hypothetical protein TNCV_879741 [Trichonephila clavipes]|nr:hypothetical protein TNCV_879741 [Trichonephila clavipes]
MFQILKDKGLLFQKTTLAMTLAEGQQTTGGKATTALVHHINTNNSPPISVPIIPLSKRGRPPKGPPTTGSSSGRRWS